MTRHVLLFVAALVTACTPQDPAARADPSDRQSDRGAGPTPGPPGTFPTSPQAPTPTVPPTIPLTIPTIPDIYHGRWGMVPLDCTGDPSAAKGLITISLSSIRFYEARAVLAEGRPAIATSFSGVFDYSGEGQAWRRTETLTRTGATLVRANEEGRFTYTRCR